MGTAKSHVTKITNRVKKLGCEYERNHAEGISTAFIKNDNKILSLSVKDDEDFILLKKSVDKNYIQIQIDKDYKMILNKIEEMFSQDDSIYIVFGDTETTGVGESDRILENACAVFKVDFKNKTLEYVEYFEEKINPIVPISPHAAAVHGIWYDEVENEPEFKDSKSFSKMKEYIDKGYIYCAHNSDFDTTMLAKEDIDFGENVIDTLNIARHLNKDDDNIESNGLQYLRYFYDFDRDPEFVSFYKSFGIEKLRPHTALSDVAVLAYYFQKLLKDGLITSVEECIHLTNSPVIQNKVTFGNVFKKGSSLYEAITSTYKQYGKSKTGISYFKWAVSNMDSLSADVIASISFYVLKGLKDGRLKMSADVIPFLYYGLVFFPNNETVLNHFGDSKDSVMKKSIEKLESSLEEVDKDSREYQGKRRMLKYIQFLTKSSNN